jgi:hypothetical protein
VARAAEGGARTRPGRRSRLCRRAAAYIGRPTVPVRILACARHARSGGNIQQASATADGTGVLTTARKRCARRSYRHARKPKGPARGDRHTDARSRARASAKLRLIRGHRANPNDPGASRGRVRAAGPPIGQLLRGEAPLNATRRQHDRTLPEEPKPTKPNEVFPATKPLLCGQKPRCEAKRRAKGSYAHG